MKLKIPSKSVKSTKHSARNSRQCEPSTSNEVCFRKFSPEGADERQMRELLFRNAFLGDSFSEICTCKEWFGDVVLGPYLRLQPENIHVAVHRETDRVIGYLTGSTGAEEFEKAQYDMVRKKVVSLTMYLAMPWTYFDVSSRVFATHVIFKGESERPSHPPAGAHWHFQVDRDFRGRGIGTQLLNRFVGEAKSVGFDLLWAEVMAYPDKPRRYFENRGWSIFDARPTSIFKGHVDFPVEVLCISKNLAEPHILTHAA